ncbi:hypothetical protein [Fimbriimonas ginsengisoli]|uniref:Uncharacterized protein n=1 Tax=Fimbriimonas ginsengisoli Gsoil 348 TaxID=661478 RepID=A0A068NPI9_FIMGI|nr:hypothetical protein [Fimbriimonas ginsengisoli]AIE85292.1 hypothetical protein OP10G_1924 [Fimbriimonas ginsengisoli Gsoil 348]
MRREWSAWIKSRQWNEFEKLAKTDPSQPLADTVAELERGFPDKPDRRALRKVLFLLGQAGYKPQPIEEGETPAAPVPANLPAEMGYLASTNGMGETMVCYGRESGSVFRWLITELDNRGAVVDASEREVPVDQVEERTAAFRTLEAAGMTGAVVPADFARARIAEVVRKSKGLPSTIAYWRSTLDGVEPIPHPADSLPRDAEADPSKDLLWAFDETMTWRLEFGSMAILVDELGRMETEEGSAGADRNAERYSEAKAKAKALVVDRAVIEDHATRLLDLAYLFHLVKKPGVGELLAAADDLRARGSESFYADFLVQKTFMLYMSELTAASRGQDDE